MTTSCPLNARSFAAARPDGPEPIIATRLPVFSLFIGFGGVFLEEKSAALLLSEHIAMGLSIAPRRHAVSQG